MYRLIYIGATIFLCIFLTFTSHPYSSGICRKCINRDFTLYTVGYEFSFGDTILIRLLNIGDGDVYIEYLDLYIVYQEDKPIYIGRFRVDSLIQSGSFYEFSIDAPSVEREVTIYLIAYLSSGYTVISNDIVLKPSNPLKLYVGLIDVFLTLASISIMGYYIFRFHIKT